MNASRETTDTEWATATVITGDGDALTTARRLAEQFVSGAAERDAQRRLPLAELDELAASGLLAITVPRTYGGADVSVRTLTEVFRLLAWADPNIAQIPQGHFVYVNVLEENGSVEQKRFFYREVLAGKRFGNAQAESGRSALDIHTRLTPAWDGGFVLSGTKKYATGALAAQWIGVLAKDADDRQVVAFVPGGSPGVQVIDDWDGMGQRTTASGSVWLSHVSVPAEHVVPHYRTFERPQVHGALAQLLHAAIDVGIARAALDDAGEFVRTRSRPWKDSGAASAAEEPLVIHQFGEMEIQLRAAEALLATAADTVDRARPEPSNGSAAEASIAVATAKAFGGRTAVEAANALFELAGTSSTSASLNLNRHWRNARTHSLHDPARWKVQHIGRYALNATRPPRSGQI
ncbi:SfnB family sulfur acquisition oxidoreductase [Haloechinothrix sp. LS1_15]|uniref:SfnB family sulfur acquisition oxidoreductase n=1 Tax=Haloechinothrix sp. LS1_15 TaxID=2652248 RepID=UPI0029444B5E|nr:SfnB family sulfur acquisition oxidoreductase [Haloechinothrix sp. LS1_15]MDV6011757.1 SfnB family sulfur acquisition oxidoreductase [Haloechinothrix sp. LS1_15]